MNIASFDDLLAAAKQQPEPQRLLFVFANAEMPQDGNAEQHARFMAGEGGALVPSMCVDKTPDELPDFAQLVAESRQFGSEWCIVFVGSLAGQGGVAPSSEAAEKPLQQMVEAIKTGILGSIIPFDRDGQPVLLN